MPARQQNDGCLSLFLPFLKLLAGGTPKESLPYRLRDDFLSPAEYSFYKVLSVAVGSQYSIQCKVRLADIFFVVTMKNRTTAQNRINQKHLDYLICDSVTMKPLLGLELDDSSHARARRYARDVFVDGVFEAAGFPLVRFPVRRHYDVQEIKDTLRPFLSSEGDLFSTAPALPEPRIPVCPKCDIPMVRRTTTKGVRTGQQFYGCPNYPRCHEARPL